MTSNTPVLLLCAILAAATSTHTARAGDLAPPAGPVAPTMKPLDQVEPRTAINAANTPGDANSIFKITQPGSYYLTGNIAGVSGRHGVEIAADHVTLDLMGFALLGVAGSLDGVATEGNRFNITIRNGTVRGWGGSGVNLIRGGAGGSGSLVENVHASNNTLFGIRANFGSLIRACTATTNGSTGINGGTQGVVEGCTALSNTGSGIGVGNSSIVNRCSSISNGGSGISGSSSSVITNNTVQSNSASGIVAVAGCYVAWNTCSGNGSAAVQAGISVIDSDNRIDGNNVTQNTTGVLVFAAGNFITRNTCSGNTVDNWNVAAGNRILVINSAAAGAVLGSAGGASPGSSDPNANYTY